MNYPFGDTVKGSDSAFPREEFSRHLAGAQAAIQAREIDLLLVNGPENIFYLCGHQTPGYYMFQCLAVPAAGEPFLVLRELECANARANTWLDDIVHYGDGADGACMLGNELIRRGWKGKRIALDRRSWFLSVAHYETLTAMLGPFVDGAGVVEGLRAVKSPLELTQIERAAEAVQAGMLAAIAEVRAGATDNDVVAAMVAAAYRHGSEYVALEPFVCAGRRSGTKHATWRRRQLRDGDFVTLENCACINRYHAALFRTAVVGDKPNDRARKMRDVCIEGLDAALENLRPGKTCADVHRAVQAIVDRHGYTDNFRKRSGYSMGIAFPPDWGEGNVLSLYEGVDVPLAPGMVFHMPISLCEYGQFTVAASETAIVCENTSRTLSTVTRALF